MPFSPPQWAFLTKLPPRRPGLICAHGQKLCHNAAGATWLRIRDASGWLGQEKEQNWILKKTWVLTFCCIFICCISISCTSISCISICIKETFPLKTQYFFICFPWKYGETQHKQKGQRNDDDRNDQPVSSRNWTPWRPYESQSDWIAVAGWGVVFPITDPWDERYIYRSMNGWFLW